MCDGSTCKKKALTLAKWKMPRFQFHCGSLYLFIKALEYPKAIHCGEPLNLIQLILQVRKPAVDPELRTRHRDMFRCNRETWAVHMAV